MHKAKVYLHYSLTSIAWRNSENSPANVLWIYLIVLPENSVCYKPYIEQLVQSHLGISLSDSVSTVLASDKAPTCIPPGSDGDIE